MKTATLRARVIAAPTLAKRRVSVTLSRGKKAMIAPPTKGHHDGQEQGYALEVFHKGLGEPPPEESEEYKARCHHERVVVYLAGDMQPQRAAKSPQCVGWPVHCGIVHNYAVEQCQHAREGQYHPVDGQLIDLIHVVLRLCHLQQAGESCLPRIQRHVLPVVGHQSPAGRPEAR